MFRMRAAVAGLLILCTAEAVHAQCTTARLISTRASNPNLVSGPIAWSGSVLGVAKTQEGVANTIWFAAYEEDLDALTAAQLVASDSREITSLQWTGTEFGLFYRTTNQRLHLQRLSTLGVPIGAPIAITPSRTVYIGDEIDVEWSPALDAYVVARVISQGSLRSSVWHTLIERDGAERSDDKLHVIASPQSQLSVVVTDSGTIGLFFVGASGGLSFARILEGETPDVRTISETPGNFVEAAAQGDRFVVVHSVVNGPKTEIRWIVVDTSHQLLKPDGLLLQGSGDDAWPAALVATDDELALAYVDAEDRSDPLEEVYRLRRFTIDGTTITDTRFAADDPGAGRATSTYDFVWTETSYVSAAFRLSPERLNSYLVRYCPLTVQIGTDVAYGRPGVPVLFTAYPQGGAPSYSYAWTFGDPTRIYRTQSVARTYDEIGSYTATLTVTDASGSTYTTTYTVEVVNVRRRATRH